MARDLALPVLLAAFDLHPPSNPRFAEMPWRGRAKKHNPKREAQAAAKHARKITRRSRK